MKIGEFSREFQVPQHTIRYYVELGLLVPEVKNHQYSFNEDCRADMKLIEKSKAVGFPLKDIHKILSLRRLSNFASPEDSGQLACIWRSACGNWSRRGNNGNRGKGAWKSGSQIWSRR